MKHFSILLVSLFFGSLALAQTAVAPSTQTSAPDASAAQPATQTNSTPSATPADPAPAAATVSAPATSAVASGTTTATASTSAVTPPQQAHYQLELMYTNYAFNQATVNSSGALTGFALGGEYDLLHSSQMILWGIDYFTGTPTTDTVGGKSGSATADTDFYTFSAAWATRQELAGSSLQLQESLGGAYRYFETKARGGKSPQQEQIFAYLPLGVSLTWLASSKWQMRLGAEEDFLVSGSSRTHMENVNPAMPTLKYSENSGAGTKVSLGARKNGKDLDLLAEVFYRNWQVSDSTTQAYVDNKGQARVGMTAANTTEMVGLGVGVTY